MIMKLGGLSQIAEGLKSNLETGIKLSKSGEQMRHVMFGKNSFPPPKIKSVFELIWENFEDPINVILLMAALVSVIIGIIKEGFPKGLIEGVSIMIALVIIITVNSGNNWISERRLANLVKIADKQEVAVYRGTDETITIDASQLVVGDIFKFGEGEKVPADSVLVTG